MGVYDRQIAAVLSALQRKGKRVIIRKDNVSVADGKPWKGGTLAAPTDYISSIIYFPFTRFGHEWLGYEKGTEIPEGQTLAVLPQLPFELTIQHYIIDGIVGTEPVLRFSSIGPLQPDGEVILYSTILQR